MFGAMLTPYFEYLNSASTPAQRHAWMMERIRDKDTNMTNRLNRRRSAIRLKWLNRCAAFVAALFAVPLVIAALNWCWSLVLG